MATLLDKAEDRTFPPSQKVLLGSAGVSPSTEMSHAMGKEAEVIIYQLSSLTG